MILRSHTVSNIYHITMTTNIYHWFFKPRLLLLFRWLCLPPTLTLLTYRAARGWHVDGMWQGGWYSHKVVKKRHIKGTLMEFKRI